MSLARRQHRARILRRDQTDPEHAWARSTIRRRDQGAGSSSGAGEHFDA